MDIIRTDRLLLRELTTQDAAFILDLYTQPSFLQFIGDRGLRNPDDARDFISKRMIDSYQRLGFGLYLVLLKEDETPIGICGLIKRDALEDVDIGYAFLPQYWSKGYAVESASAVLTYARDTLGIKRLAAITLPDNHSSIRVLEKIGLKYKGMVKLPNEDIENKLFVADL
ncbi:MAG: GNAT family N-acetyltransferase [Chloroflexi bacterium]|nr:GNAT family N-acetyltransferase [Chloroflexota bacterium]